MFKPRTTLIALFVLLPSFATLAQTRRPITHEDVWLMKRVEHRFLAPTANG